MKAIFFWRVFALAAAGLPATAQQPLTTITSLERGGRIYWKTDHTNGVALIEKATSLPQANWKTVSTEPIAPGPRVSTLPYAPEPQHFYRINTIVGPSDPSLLLHIGFDNDLSTGLALDTSGYANHGRRYDTNHWPISVQGPDGSRAGEFRVYYDGYGPGGKSGDYIAIAHTPALRVLPTATIMGWARYYLTPPGGLDHTATIIDGAGAATPGSWTLGRVYSGNTRFALVGPGNTTVYAVRFPDETRTGDTGGWNHYAVTFNAGSVSGYFNGKGFLSTNIPFQNLVLGGEFMCISCWNHSGTPEWDDADQLPNNAFMNGAIDNVRIYNRVLSPDEIKSIFEQTGPKATQ